MAILIDGYNLLHQTGRLGRGVGPGSLERARSALLNFLAGTLDETQRSQTTVVFDAKDAPPGLPQVQQHQQITVRYATGYDEADDLLEQLIRNDSAPKQLTVVSSDRRLQQAARRRRARAVDSDAWYAELKAARHLPPPTPPAKPTGPLDEDEVQRWLEEFGLDDEER